MNNLYYTFDEGSESVRVTTVRDFQKGEEITYKYNPQHTNTQTFAHYGFVFDNNKEQYILIKVTPSIYDPFMILKRQIFTKMIYYNEADRIYKLYIPTNFSSQAFTTVLNYFRIDEFTQDEDVLKNILEKVVEKKIISDPIGKRNEIKAMDKMHYNIMMKIREYASSVEV